MTNLEALKALHAQLGGTEEAVADATTTLEVLNAISAIYDGESGTQNANAIDEISKVASAGGLFTSPFELTVDSIEAGAGISLWYYALIDGEVVCREVPLTETKTYLVEVATVPCLYKSQSVSQAMDAWFAGTTGSLNSVAESSGARQNCAFSYTPTGAIARVSFWRPILDKATAHISIKLV